MASDFDAIVAGLVALHVPREKAEARAREICGLPSAAPASRVTAAAAPLPGAAVPTLVLPVTVVIPWSHLVSDDDKYGVMKGRMILQQRYREMRSAIRTRARKQVGEVLPVTYPVALEAMVYVPDNRIHDVPNFAKLVHDALEKVIYPKDSLLWRAVWERAGVDVDQPRAEVTVAPYLGRRTR